ncbi:MAG: hypothetical protein EOP50_21460 [Sphingobacteriales bacterium]|nr:MAG: hypothetical protein EOP50_21460 [Sphingobacteriales bacterium]
MFSNLKIGVRLIGGFLIVAGISAIVGSIGISNASKMNEMADDMYAMELMGLSYIKEANINLIYIARARANYSKLYPGKARFLVSKIAIS